MTVRPLDRASRIHLIGCALFTVGAAALICGGVSLVGLVGALVAAGGSLTMARTAQAAGAA